MEVYEILKGGDIFLINRKHMGTAHIAYIGMIKVTLRCENRK